MKNTLSSPCPGCNGTGQMTWFGGVSRFQFSYTDCPECNGVGFLEIRSEKVLGAEEIAEDSTLTRKQAEVFLAVLAKTLTQVLTRGERVKLRGFGSFSHQNSPSSAEKILFTPAKHLLHGPLRTDK